MPKMLLPLNGRLVTIAEAARATGLAYPTIWERLRRGWPRETCLRPLAKQSKLHLHKGRMLTVREIAEEEGVNANAIHYRLKKASEPPREKVQRVRFPVTYQGRTQSLSAWARELGMKVDTLANRLASPHWTLERAFTEPVNQSLRKQKKATP